MIGFYFVTKSLMTGLEGYTVLRIFGCAIIGLVLTALMVLITEYYTTNSRKPTQSIAEAAQTGAGTNVIQGLAVGMRSTLIPVIKPLRRSSPPPDGKITENHLEQIIDTFCNEKRFKYKRA